MLTMLSVKVASNFTWSVLASYVKKCRSSSPEVFAGKVVLKTQQIYIRTPISQCDFKKVAKQLY